MKFKIIYAAAALLMFASCSKEESYSELLRDEEKTVNWFLANNKVEVEIPADSIFIEGKDAPYYRLDSEGRVYMQVLNSGTPGMKPQKDDKVYFRFMRQNLKTLQEMGEAQWVGNADNLGSGESSSFIFGNNYLESTLVYGDGIQWPLKYLNYNSEVNIVVKSLEGFNNEASQCIPYLMNVRYFKAEY